MEESLPVCCSHPIDFKLDGCFVWDPGECCVVFSDEWQASNITHYMLLDVKKKVELDKEAINKYLQMIYGRHTVHTCRGGVKRVRTCVQQHFLHCHRDTTEAEQPTRAVTIVASVAVNGATCFRFHLHQWVMPERRKRDTNIGPLRERMMQLAPFPIPLTSFFN